MKAATVSKRWIGIPLLVGLLALLATVGVGAQAPEVAEPLLAPTYGIAIHCDTAILEEGDPFMLVEEVDLPCLAVTAAKVSSIEFAGNTAWVWSTATGETELHVYVKRDGVWERFPYSSTPDSEYLYMLEQENLSMALANAWSQSVPESRTVSLSSDIWAPHGAVYETRLAGYVGELDDEGAGVSVALESSTIPLPWSGETWAPRGAAYEEQLASYLGELD